MLAMISVISGNNLLYLVLAAMFSVLLISGFVSKLVLAGLEVDLVVPEHISARRKTAATLRFKNLKRWMPTFSIRISGTDQGGLSEPIFFPVVPGGTRIDEPVELYFAKRGRYEERTFQLSTRFPFGFAERHERVTLRQSVVVYPCLDPHPGFEELASSIVGQMESAEDNLQRGTGQDFYRFRPYQISESARHVDWKATAHTGALQVREFARDEEQALLIYLDLDVPAEYSVWFEAAVECAAFLAFRLSQSGRAVRLLTQDADLFAAQHDGVYTILRYLGLVTARPGWPPMGPENGSGWDQFHIALSARPALLGSLGWETDGPRSKVFGPQDIA